MYQPVSKRVDLRRAADHDLIYGQESYSQGVAPPRGVLRRVFQCGSKSEAYLVLGLNVSMHKRLVNRVWNTEHRSDD